MRNSVVLKIVDFGIKEEEKNDYLSYSALHKAFSTEDTDLQKRAIANKAILIICTAFLRGYFSKEDLVDGRGSCDLGVNSLSRELSFIEDFVGTDNLERIVGEYLDNVKIS